jgi:hypothetical protein
MWEQGPPENLGQFLAVARPHSGLTTLIRVRCGGGHGHGSLPPALRPWPLPLYRFNSFFSALRKRQSVPWAISFWGLALIIPASCRRRA